MDLWDEGCRLGALALVGLGAWMILNHRHRGSSAERVVMPEKYEPAPAYPSEPVRDEAVDGGEDEEEFTDILSERLEARGLHVEAVASGEAALEKVLARCVRLETESVGLLDALGRVMATDALSDVDVSPFDNSAMDGFALRSADVAGASEADPVVLQVVGTLAAGTPPTREVGPGEAIRIMTGAPMPDGADAVIMVELTELAVDEVEKGDRLSADQPVYVRYWTRSYAGRMPPPSCNSACRRSRACGSCSRISPLKMVTLTPMMP